MLILYPNEYMNTGQITKITGSNQTLNNSLGINIRARKCEWKSRVLIYYSKHIVIMVKISNRALKINAKSFHGPCSLDYVHFWLFVLYKRGFTSAHILQEALIFLTSSSEYNKFLART